MTTTEEPGPVRIPAPNESTPGGQPLLHDEWSAVSSRSPISPTGYEAVAERYEATLRRRRRTKLFIKESLFTFLIVVITIGLIVFFTYYMDNTQQLSKRLDIPGAKVPNVDVPGVPSATDLEWLYWLQKFWKLLLALCKLSSSWLINSSAGTFDYWNSSRCLLLSRCFSQPMLFALLACWTLLWYVSLPFHSSL